MNREYRERLESDERMARELLEQMEMEERRREEEDEQLARRLAGEMENNTLTEDEFDDDIVFQAEVEEDVGGDEDMARQLEAEAQAEAEALQPREEEDERAGRVAALINMFPDADPTFLDDRMEEVNNEEDFRHAVEALLACQRTEPRMSGHQRKLKQCRAAPDALDDAALHNPHQEFLGLPAATLAAASVRVMECTICFEEEVPLKDVASCNALYKYHEFCIECIRKHVAALIGQGHNSFRCMNGYCEAEFSWRTLRRVMEPVVYRKVQERRQQEEVRAAGMDNLVSCPFCCFMIIMPDPENKVLECLNPECLKESCRVCKEPSHIPLRCEEVERDDQKDARTVLENKMAEAMIRQCPKCEKRFVTEGGCNKMTCACGTVMCYLCKAVITQGYHHFEQRGVASNK
ncbi:E3 ubiquitin-protein ligase RNF216 [Chionoecetes opilio]|uniref:E3 ubiquitin-protein ligase RNF216 n=1 Tax=Chionoecetes opilio TaxID=41210 RepID=A0A8J5CV32_CHIOP|nr:E3 ubiquitin-protein ligase RNF216 [Chionoecetes opilio]